MMRLFAPLFCIIAAIVIFLVPTRRALEATKPLTERRAVLETALDSAKKIQTVRETLQDRYNAFRPEDVNRLQKMVPSHVDNVRLVIDIDSIARTYGMTLKDVDVEQPQAEPASPSSGAIVGDTPDHLDLRFVVNGSYAALKLFLADLGKSLRIVDITDLAFSAKDADNYDFSIGLRTYWLQDK